MPSQALPNSTASTDPFSLLLANLKQEQARIQSTESLLDSLASTTINESQTRFRMEAAQKLAAALQKDREIILGQIAKQTGVELKGLNLTALIAVCPPVLREDFYAAKRSLFRTLYQAQRSTGSAAILVSESLRLQQTVLSSLMGMSASDRYDANGSQPMDSCSTRMESRS